MNNSNEFSNLILKDNKFKMTIAQKFGSPTFFVRDLINKFNKEFKFSRVVKFLLNSK